VPSAWERASRLICGAAVTDSIVSAHITASRRRVGGRRQAQYSRPVALMAGPGAVMENKQYRGDRSASIRNYHSMLHHRADWTHCDELSLIYRSIMFKFIVFRIDVFVKRRRGYGLYRPMGTRSVSRGGIGLYPLQLL